MNTKEVFVRIQELSQELKTLTVESNANIATIKNVCYDILTEIDKLNPESVSQHVILTKNQAEQYIRKGLAEIEKYNDKEVLRSLGNFIDVLRPIQAGLEMILNLNY
jgi:regulator of replication initiation timing